MHDLYIVGAGGLGRGLADALVYDNEEHIAEEFDNIYFVDDNGVDTEVNGFLVRFNIKEFVDINEQCLVINAIGMPTVRETIQYQLNRNSKFTFPNYIDSDVKLYENVKYGKGNIITRGVVFSTNIEIGDFNFIHFNSTVGHDVKMGDYNCVYPLTSLSGHTVIGNANMIGTGSTSLPQAKLEDYVNVGANSLIRGNYKSNITVAGSPAERLEL